MCVLKGSNEEYFSFFLFYVTKNSQKEFYKSVFKWTKIKNLVAYSNARDEFYFICDLWHPYDLSCCFNWCHGEVLKSKLFIF
jgi:hypothetical protein